MRRSWPLAGSRTAKPLDRRAILELLELLPMLLLIVLLNTLTLLIFSQPMQARGSLLQ